MRVRRFKRRALPSSYRFGHQARRRRPFAERTEGSWVAGGGKQEGVRREAKRIMRRSASEEGGPWKLHPARPASRTKRGGGVRAQPRQKRLRCPSPPLGRCLAVSVLVDRCRTRPARLTAVAGYFVFVSALRRLPDQFVGVPGVDIPALLPVVKFVAQNSPSRFE